MSGGRQQSLLPRAATVLRAGIDTIGGRPENGRVPALDFLRSMAVLTVVCGHWATAFRRAGGVEVGVERWPMFYFGWTGVDIFFVLSGYLIGRQLWTETAATGTVVFRRFFARRAMRIWPLYFLVCLIVTIFSVPGESPAKLADILFFSNYAPHGVAGGWSLSTEEQFYILGPLVIIALGRFIPLKGFFVVIAAAGVATLIARNTSYHALVMFTDDQSPLYYPFHMHNDGLLVGLTIALIFTLRPQWLKRDDLSRPGWIAGLAAVMLGFALYAIEGKLFNFLSLGLIFGGIMFALLLDRTIVTRLLPRRPFHALSVLSYGMYLNHFVLAEVLPPPWVKATANWPPAVAYLLGAGMLFLLSAMLSSVTYVLVEHPFLLLRDRWLKHEKKPVAGK